ncbi:MAG: hypothetical protein ACOC3D_04655 [Pseudomonadota bacterium]
MSELTPAQIAAVAGVIATKDATAARAALDEHSKHHVDVLLSLRAIVEKGEPTTAKPTASLLSKASVAWLLRRLGATRETTQKLLAELAGHALESGGKIGDGLVDADDRILLAIHDLEKDVVAKLPPQHRSPRVKVAGEVKTLREINAEADDAPSSIQLLTSDCQIQAADQPGDGTAGPPRFNMVAYTGGPMKLRGWAHPVVVDLQGLNVQAQSRPVRFNHDSNRGVGHTDRIAIEGSGGEARLVASGLISRQTTEAHEVIAAARAGFPWQASIGAAAERVEFVRQGASVNVNGRAITGPAYIARQASLGEISVVDLGGDQGTSTSIAATHHNHTTSTNGDSIMTFEQWLQAKGFDINNLSDTQKATLQAAYDAEQNTQDTGDQDGSSGRNAADGSHGSHQVNAGDANLDTVLSDAQREARRRQQIGQATQRILAERPEMHDQIGRLAQGAIEANWDAQRYELELLRLGRGSNGFVRRDQTRDGRVIEAALCIAGGLDQPEEHFPDQTLEAADRQFGRGLGLGEVLLMHAHANGYRGHGTSNLRGLLQAAFADGEVQAAGYSTISLSGILSNTANKFLRQGFNSVESAWRDVSARRSVRDFKQITSYSLTGGMKYEKVGPTGELKHAEAGERSYTNQAETYGRMFGLTRQDIINDDLGALTQVPQRLGRGGAIKLNEVFWTEFLDNSDFFEADNNNYKDGATTSLGIDSLTTAEEVFFDQTDPDGNPLGLMPAILLVPNALNALAAQLMNSTEIRPSGGSTSSTAKTPVSNPHAGKFRAVRSSYLSATALSGNSNKAWYLLADPNDMPVIEVAFLNGREQPVVESADADFNTLGVQMRGYHDFGVNKQEYRAGVKMKGEA